MRVLLINFCPVRYLSQTYCPNLENYSPCMCPIQGKKYFVLECVGVSTEHVRNIFISTKSVDFDQISFQLNDSLFPMDLFVSHRANSITVCGNNSNPQQFYPDIHPDAFRSSRNFTVEFNLKSINMCKMNLSFLATFYQLKTLSIWNSVGLNSSSFPPLPNLINLWITDSKFNSNGWSIFLNSIKCLEELNLENNGLNNEQVDQILELIFMSPSKDTLTLLDLSSNSLTRIPSQVKYFSRVNKIYLNNQNGQGFGIVSEISLLAPVRFLDLTYCSINEIQTTTFQGFNCIDYTNAPESIFF